MYVMANQNAQLRLTSRPHGTFGEPLELNATPLSPVLDPSQAGMPGVDLEQHHLSLALDSRIS